MACRQLSLLPQQIVKQKQGFTLVELILVIVLIAIISVSVTPVFFSRGGFVEYTFADRLVALLQLVQLQAMNQSGACHEVMVTFERFGVPSPCSSNLLPAVFQPDSLGIAESEATIANLILNAPFSVISFDTLGRPIDPQTGNLICQSGCIVQITGASTVNVRIEGEGYIDRF